MKAIEKGAPSRYRYFCGIYLELILVKFSDSDSKGFTDRNGSTFFNDLGFFVPFFAFIVAMMSSQLNLPRRGFQPYRQIASQ
ncbi:MAG: hypothetical protein ACRD8A_02040 [Candidatus Acidiferrales bacterium]